MIRRSRSLSAPTGAQPTYPHFGHSVLACRNGEPSASLERPQRRHSTTSGSTGSSCLGPAPWRPPTGGRRLALALGRLRRHAFGGVEQLVPGEQLHARPAQLLAGGSLELVDRGPARVQHGANASLREQRLDRFGGRLVLMRDASLLRVLE